ncbi:hypothetical protein BDY21DRAFT_95977 [Lineolata rhizophorae]|uniref:Uncharacterized protein n=1 Tax=Lineolata rhizophorae TaxID=578093 RepID=A0A6A6NSY0_9PEZI|nr:hypothetical protein BDY21DRAFT_95977 [Lineolata rhizophorae]
MSILAHALAPSSAPAPGTRAIGGSADARVLRSPVAPFAQTGALAPCSDVACGRSCSGTSPGPSPGPSSSLATACHLLHPTAWLHAPSDPAATLGDLSSLLESKEHRRASESRSPGFASRATACHRPPVASKLASVCARLRPLRPAQNGRGH